MRPILYSWSVELASIYNFSEVFTQWGPAYVITFEVRITQFDGQLVYFGTKNGDSVPSVVAKNNKLIITTFVHGKEIEISSEEIKTNTKYTVTISQLPSSEDTNQVLIKYIKFTRKLVLIPVSY